MYENITQETLLERMLERVPDTIDKRPSSLVYDTHSATAIELQILYIELEYLIKNSYGDTAAREFLILLAKDRGLSPEPATKAVLQGEFTPTNIDVTGKRFNIGEINYVVTEQIAPGTYKVQCETEGTAGNQHLGNMIPMEYIDGLQTASLTGVLVPGEEEEETEAFRQRYFDSFKGQAFGGNRADYTAKVRGIAGVGGVKVTRVWNGDIRPADMIPKGKVASWYQSVAGGLDAEVAKWLSSVYTAASEKKLTVGGTVRVTVVNALDFGKASDVLLENIQKALDPEENAGEGYGLAPIGHVVSVKSAVPVEIHVTTMLTFEEGYGWDNMKQAVQDAVSEYLLNLRRTWADGTSTVVRLSQVEACILSIEGIADIAGTKLNGKAANVTLGNYEIPVSGGVSV